MLLVTAACVSGPARRVGTPPPPATAVPADPSAPPGTPTAPPATLAPTPTATVAAATTLAPTPATTPAAPVLPSAPAGLVLGEPAPQPADLVRTDGGPLRLADEAGHPTILFFGYTHCPDVCPETIATLLEVARERPETRIVFVTVDPERDTQEFLAQWVAYLPDNLVGATGTPDAIRRAADLYGVQYARVDTGSRAGYAMAHTAFQYLIDGTGVLARIYPFATPAETIVSDLDLLR
jgi:protein SCO1/2